MQSALMEKCIKEWEEVMRKNKHTEFLKNIRLKEETIQENIKTQKARAVQTPKRTRQEESDLQKELEKRFDELFGLTETD